MDSTNIDVLHARLKQIGGILLLLDPDSENSALWAVQDLLDQAKEAADRLWEQGLEAIKEAQQATV
jgi:hypothetical protein